MSGTGKDRVAAKQVSTGSIYSFAIKHIDVLALIAIFLLAFGIRYVTLMDAGLTWDEQDVLAAGMKYGHNLESLKFDAGSWSYLSEHGPVSKYIYGLVLGLLNHRALDLAAFEISRTVSAFIGVATCFLVYFLGREFFNRRVAFVSALVLALIPTFIAHTQVAAIDGPIAFFYTLTMGLFLVAIKKNNLYWYIASAISLGFLIDVKFNGLVAIPAMGLSYLVYKYMNRFSRESPRGKSASLKDTIVALFKYYVPVLPLIGFGILTLATIYFLWPWLWPDPIGRLSLSLAHWEYVPIEYFLGQPQVAPPTYYIAYLLVTTPLLLLIPLPIGVYGNLKSKDVYKYAMLIWFVVPFAYSFSGFIQGGMRYLLMIFPPMAILIAQGLYCIAEWAERFKLPRGTVFAILSALTLVYLLFTAASISPYYLDYYNALAGGPAHVQQEKLFNIGWWGEGTYSAVNYVETTAVPNSTVYVLAMPNHQVHFYGLKNNYVCPDIKGDFVVPGTPDYIVDNFFTGEYFNATFDRSKYELVYVSSVQNATLTEVYKHTG